MRYLCKSNKKKEVIRWPNNINESDTEEILCMFSVSESHIHFFLRCGGTVEGQVHCAVSLRHYSCFLALFRLA